MTSEKNRTCREEDLILYHYGELGEERMEEIFSHLPVCSGCRRELDSIRRTLAAAPDSSLNLTEVEKARFAARVTGKLASRRRFGVRSIWGSAAAATAVLIFGFFAMSPDSPHLSENPELTAESEILPDLEMLENMELLENLDLLQDLEGMGEQPT